MRLDAARDVGHALKQAAFVRISARSDKSIYRVRVGVREGGRRGGPRGVREREKEKIKRLRTSKCEFFSDDFIFICVSGS